MKKLSILQISFAIFLVVIGIIVFASKTSLAQEPGQVMTMAGNFPRDLYGPVDTRPDCYGNADSQILDITFKPPKGMRTRVLRARGDLVSWIMTDGKDVPRGTHAGVLLGLQSTAATHPNTDCTWCAKGVMLYIQDSVSDKHDIARSQFDYDNIDMLLEPDNILQVKLASWLNTTGFPIHMEATYTVTYRWEPITK